MQQLSDKKSSHLSHETLAKAIEAGFENRSQLTPKNVPPALKEAVNTTIDWLDKGTIRVAEKANNQWQVNVWVKKAVLLYFCITPKVVMEGGFSQFYDKVPLKFGHDAPNSKSLDGADVRVVPPATVRYGAYVGAGTVLMPSYVNIGAFVDSGVLVDTWATVGSCAQIGKNVHLSGGAGIGGVLEPLQANPTIIEDDCFIGARSEVVEGVIVEKGAVISMGVFLGQSTKIYDRETGEVSYGRVPAGAVVVPGTLPSPDGSHALQCAVIVKRVDAATRKKVGINALLRD